MNLGRLTRRESATIGNDISAPWSRSPLAGATGHRWPALLCCLAALVAPALRAQEAALEGPRPTYTVHLTADDIAIDGRLTEAVWQLPPTFELAFETRPAENGPAPVRTEVWIAYDLHNLFVAFRAHDPEPDKIRARLSDRDAAYQDDFVGIALDTFNDERRAFEFFANPLGVQMDMTQNEMTGEEDDSWDAIWDSAGRITGAGYTVEMRIPFSSLRFPDSADGMTWGIDAIRMLPRDQRYRLALQPLARGSNCYLCQASKLVGFEGVRPARSIELDPTLTASVSGLRADFPAGELEDSDPDIEPGITARWGLTPNLMLNATLNPDFSQVEADAAQLDVNTQFALFYPEKRPFFLEGADIFGTRFNAIYSRNIADPDWGIKLTGKVGRNALGVIVARDSRTNFLIPSSQSSELDSLDEKNLSTIVRYRRDLFGATTGGVFYTGREGDGYHNRLVGADVLFRFCDTEAARIEILGSETLYPAEIAAAHGQSSDEISDLAARIVYQHTSRNWMTYLLYRDVGEDFRADLGFVPQADFVEWAGALERAWYPESSGWSEVRVGVEADDVEDQDGRHLSRTVDTYAWANGPRQSFVRLSLISGDLSWGDELFDIDRVYVYGEVQALPSVYASLEATVGGQVDFAGGRQADQLRLDPGLRLDLGRHLRLELDHSHERLDVDAGWLYTARLSQLKTTYQLNVRTFVRWIGQYLDLSRNAELHPPGTPARDRKLFNQLLFSYTINPQTVLFLGYSDTSLGDDRVDLTRQSRTVFLKIGYAWLL
ncbi:MAG TPA: DUF5916 domain-containing protein [Methylomirabilota bacterium]|nr:DUF5916 domain-containing protein [Methylomirabilota bacterium]